MKIKTTFITAGILSLIGFFGILTVKPVGVVMLACTGILVILSIVGYILCIYSEQTDKHYADFIKSQK
jgi:hypothetical protein